MGPVDFIASLGGLFGLFLGFSIVSFVEIIYWIVVRGSKIMLHRKYKDFRSKAIVWNQPQTQHSTYQRIQIRPYILAFRRHKKRIQIWSIWRVISKLVIQCGTIPSSGSPHFTLRNKSCYISESGKSSYYEKEKTHNLHHYETTVLMGNGQKYCKNYLVFLPKKVSTFKNFFELCKK